MAGASHAALSQKTDLFALLLTRIVLCCILFVFTSFQFKISKASILLVQPGSRACVQAAREAGKASLRLLPWKEYTNG